MSLLSSIHVMPLHETFSRIPYSLRLLCYYLEEAGRRQLPLWSIYDENETLDA